MLEEYTYEFSAKLKRHQFGRTPFTVAYLPQDIINALPLDKHPRLRIDGAVNGVRVSNALHPSGGRWYVLVPKRIQKKCNVKLGDTVYIQFDIGDQDAVEIPDELKFALEVNDRASAVWAELTPGKKRGFAYRVSSAKRAETRENRVEEVIEQLLELAAGNNVSRGRWR